MSIRKKTIILVGLMACLLTGLIVYFVSRLFITRFDKLELSKVSDDIVRVQETFNAELAHLSTKVSDWSSWDDTYSYIRTKDSRFIDSNIQNQTFTNLQINTIIFVDENRRIVHASSYEDDTETLESSISATLADVVTTSEKFYRAQKNGDEVHGVLVVDNRPLMIAARPILQSDGQGPRRGMMFFGRWLTPELATEISQRIKLPLTFTVIDSGEPISEDIREELARQQEIIIEPFSDTVMEADLFYKDVFDEPAIYFHLALPRDIHAQGYAVTRLVGIVSASLGGVFVVLILIIMDRLIISRIIRISESITRLGSQGDLHGRIPSDNSRDEVSSLVTTINTTLASLETSQALLTEERLRVKHYIDSAGVMFVVLDAHAMVLLINNKSCSILGRSSEECIGKNWFDIAVPKEIRSDRLLEFATILQAEKTSTIHYIEYMVVARDESTRLIGWHTTLLHDRNGQVASVILSGEDITDQRESERVLQNKNAELESTKSAMLNILEDERLLEGQLKHEKESVERKVVLRTQELMDEKAKLLASINSLNLGYLLMDREGRALISNTKMETMFSRMHQNNSIMLHHLMLSLGSDIHLEEEFLQCLTTRKTITHESVTYGNRYLRLMLIPVVLPQGESTIGVVFLVEDISERKILDRSRDEFFSIASHELRTPLTAIRGNTSMMLEYFGPALADPQLHEMVSDVHDSSVRLISIVNDFLNVSRLEQKRLSYAIAPVDVRVLCTDVIQEYRVTGSHNHLQLSFESPTNDALLVLADKDRLREVLINLVGNSLKFTESGSVIIRAEKMNAHVEIQIQDTGRGISTANQPLLFHKFQQATDSLFTRDTTKGTGLGLYISKLIIEGMHGSIRLVGSALGKGTTMAIQLPIAQ